MKKLIILLAVLIPLASFGAYQMAQEIKFWEYKVQINSDRGNIYVYEAKIGTSTCFVAQQNIGQGGSSIALSCK